MIEVLGPTAKGDLAEGLYFWDSPRICSGSTVVARAFERVCKSIWSEEVASINLPFIWDSASGESAPIGVPLPPELSPVLEELILDILRAVMPLLSDDDESVFFGLRKEGPGCLAIPLYGLSTSQGEFMILASLMGRQHESCTVFTPCAESVALYLVYL